MTMRFRFFIPIALIIVFAAPQHSWAQNKSASDRLLRIVPGDYGFYLLVNGLRDQMPKWRKNLKTFEQSPVKKLIEATTEWQELQNVADVFEGAFEIDWPTFRDDVIGDAVIFAYRPGPPGHPEDEQGVVMLQARNALMVTRLIDRLNEIQQQTGELQDLQTRTYKETPYVRRSVDKKTQFYVQIGPLFAFSDKEDAIKKVIERVDVKDPSPLSRQLQRAGAESALVTLLVNPRAFDAVLDDKAEKQKTPALHTLMAVWRALEAVVISARSEEAIDVSLSIQARASDMPTSLAKLFLESSEPSDLWRRFPDAAILSVAGRADIGAWKEALGSFVPDADRKNLATELQKNVGSALGLDLFQDVLPNIGPDFGLSLFAAADDKHLPQVVAAVAVKPGTGATRVDQSLFKGVQFMTGILLFEHNRTHDDPLRLMVKQDKVEVAYLVGNLPPGLQPACALKDGYLVLASSPEAIQRFSNSAEAAPTAKDLPFLRFSASKMADLMKQHRLDLAAFVGQTNNLPPVASLQRVDGILGVLSMFDRLELIRTASDGQLRLTLRVYPTH